MGLRPRPGYRARPLACHYHRGAMTTKDFYKEHWGTKADERAREGVLDEMVSAELFDHTWIAAIRQLERHLEFADGQHVLDAGCGWGRLMYGVKYFHPGVSIDGYELTSEFAEKARALMQRDNLAEGVNIVQADLLEVDLPRERYDSFYCSRVLHYIDRKEPVVGKLYDALKAGGRGMIIIPNRNSPRQRLRYKHAPLYPIRDVGALMENAGFRNIRYGGYRILPASRRFAHDSIAGKIEVAVASSPLGRFGGLAYAVGDK